MNYINWAVLYEGSSDQSYFDLLIPRVMEDLVARFGIRNSTIPLSPSICLKRGSVNNVAKEACAAQDAFRILFIHADTGGRSLEGSLQERSGRYCEAIHYLCEFPRSCCITIAPRHETEAWILADPAAVTGALGFCGSFESIGLPANGTEAERLSNPKGILSEAIRAVRGRRRAFSVDRIFPAIAQRQSLSLLRSARSFSLFEIAVQKALRALSCIV